MFLYNFKNLCNKRVRRRETHTNAREISSRPLFIYDFRTRYKYVMFAILFIFSILGMMLPGFLGRPGVRALHGPLFLD
jgi:hypothetical protein